MTTPKEQNLTAAPAVKNDSAEKITELYNFMLEQKLEEIELKNKTFYLKLKRRTGKVLKAAVYHHAAGTAAPVPEPVMQGTPIKSPLNGTFYRAASPQSQPFVKEGDVVENGAVLCIVEAMKVMNEIRAEKRCRVLRILIENGKPVNADQDMFLIEGI